MSGAKPRLLLVDDDAALLRLMTMRLEAAGYAVTAVDSGERAPAELAAARPQLVITDMRMPGIDGLSFLRQIKALDADTEVILVTAYASVGSAVEAIKIGAVDYFEKPVNLAWLEAKIRAIAEKVVLRAENRQLKAELARVVPGPEVIGRNQAFKTVIDLLDRVAPSDASVLFLGESGTGKEVLSRFIHARSLRADGPFVAVNCAAIPEHLLESELFGHAKGAFSGAIYAHRGLFQAAQRGTLFLDEIGDMPLALQVKLLRALQDRSVRPVGSTEMVPVDVRIISATHRDLSESIRGGTFRPDLYYRLNVVSLALPPLSERREDIPLLCAHFVEMLAERYSKPARTFSPEAMELLVNATWPGNVRQLLNVVEQTVALSTSPVVPASLVQKALRDDNTLMVSLDEARRAFEHDYLVRLLRATEGNVTQAARMAQRNRTEFYKLLQRHDLTPALFKAEKA